MAKIELIMTGEEIQKEISYQLICHVRHGSVWDTMRRRLLWDMVFSEEEKEKAEKMFRQAYTWYVNGIPDTVRMDFPTYLLWDKIESFCCDII